MLSELLTKLPKNWFEVTVSQYQELIEIEAQKESLTNTEYFIEKLALLFDVGPDDEMFDIIDTDELFQLINAISWTNSPIPVCNPEKYNDLVPKKFTSILLGEFIDLEHYMTDPNNNLHKISAILYKQTRINDWGNQEIEPYEYDLEERAEMFLDAPVPGAYNLINSYTSWRKTFIENYEELFQGEQETDEDDELEGYEKIEQQKKLQKEKVLVKWSWENMIWNLCKEDITKMKSVFGLEVILVFNMLSMKKSLEK